MNDQIRKIIEDLYQLDPELKKQEERLVALLEKLLADKPEIQINDDFVRDLRAKLMVKAATANTEEQRISFLLNRKLLANLAYAAAGAIIVAILAVPIYRNGQQKIATKSEKKPMMAVNMAGMNINKITENAFGSLTATNQKQQTDSLGGGQPAPASPQATVEKNVTSASPQAAAKNNIAPDSFAGVAEAERAAIMEEKPLINKEEPSSIMPPFPEIIRWQYVYKGDSLLTPEDKASVLRRQQSGENLIATTQLLNTTNFGLVNVANFSDMKVHDISFVQDQDYGYMVNLNFFYGTAEISKNWNRWPNPFTGCYDMECSKKNQLKKEDLLAKEAVLQLVQDFISKYQINMESYGPPELQQPSLYENINEENIPEEINVIYPLLYDGQPVYDQWGGRSGITVGVSLREKKITNVYGLITRNYDSSEYPLEKDTGKILDIAQKGGINSYDWYPPETNVKKIDIKLGTPQRTYISYYQWDEKTGQSSELLVPAYVFPVMDMPQEAKENYGLPSSVVVPLVKDILDKSTQPAVFGDSVKSESRSQ